jgi:hypothetical protein
MKLLWTIPSKLLKVDFTKIGFLSKPNFPYSNLFTKFLLLKTFLSKPIFTINLDFVYVGPIFLGLN